MTAVLAVDTAGWTRRAGSRSRVLWVGAAGIAALALTVQPFADGGAWQQLALGRLISSHGVPASEPFSFLPGAHPWVGGGWLLAVLLAGLTRAGGLGLAALVTAAAAGGGLVLAALAVRPRARVAGPWLAFAVVAAAVVGRPWLANPGTAVFVLAMGAVLNIVARQRDGETRPLWLLPPIFLLWANLDPGFLAGLGVLLVALLTIRPSAVSGRSTLLAILGLSAALTLLTPSGPALYQSLLDRVGTGTQLSAAFASPDFHTTSLRLFEALIALVVVCWAAGGDVDRFDLTVGIASLGLALWSAQFVPLAIVVVAPQLARYGWRAWHRHVAARVPQLGPGTPRLRTLAAGAAVAAVVAGAVVVVARQASPAAAAAAESSHAPRGAADYVAAAFPGQRLYSTPAWGSYLAYRFPTGRVVFIYDGGAFPDASVAEYTTVHLLGSNWESVIRRNGITHAIVADTSQEAGALHEVGWAVDCFDAPSAALVMSAPPPGAPQVPSAALTVPPANAKRC